MNDEREKNSEDPTLTSLKIGLTSYKNEFDAYYFRLGVIGNIFSDDEKKIIEDLVKKIEAQIASLRLRLSELTTHNINYINEFENELNELKRKLGIVTSLDQEEVEVDEDGIINGEYVVINAGGRVEADEPDPREEERQPQKSIFELRKGEVGYDELHDLIQQTINEFALQFRNPDFKPEAEVFGGRVFEQKSKLLNAYKYLSELRVVCLKLVPSPDEYNSESYFVTNSWADWFGSPPNYDGGVFEQIYQLQEILVKNSKSFKRLKTQVEEIKKNKIANLEFFSDSDLSNLIFGLSRVISLLNTSISNFETTIVGLNSEYIKKEYVVDLLNDARALFQSLENNLEKHTQYRDLINNVDWGEYLLAISAVVDNAGILRQAFTMTVPSRNFLLGFHNRLLSAYDSVKNVNNFDSTSNTMIVAVVERYKGLYDKAIRGLEEKEVEEFEGRVEVRSYLSLLNRIVLDNGDINPLAKTLSLKELRNTKKQLIDLDICKKHLSSAFGEDLKNYLLKVQTRLKTALDYLDGVTKETQEEKTRERNRKSVEALFIDRGVPLRKELEPVGDYLERIHPYLVSLANGIVYNSIYDNASEPYTLDYKLSPLRGPNKHMSIADHPLTHSKSLELDVKNFDSLWDLFASTFEDPTEKKLVGEYSERQKALHSEISLWHNRAVIRRSNESKAGPDASFAGIMQIFNEKKYAPDLSRVFSKKENLLEGERKQLEATEFCMSVWSTMHLSMAERRRLWSHISPRVKTFFQERVEDGEMFYDVKPEFRQAPIYKGKPQLQLALVKEIMRHAGEIIGNLRGDDDGSHKKRMAELAYSISESYRIGFGMDAFFDIEYAKDGEGNSYAKVLAKEGEPKAAMVGLYAESTNMNVERTNFNGAFATHMVRAYPSLSRVIQYNHNCNVAGLRFDISGLGDMRSSLAEILSTEGAIWDTDFSSTSSDPDKIIADVATEAQTFWTSSQISNTLEGKGMLLWSPKMRLEATEIINQPNEYGPLATYFDPTKRLAQSISRGLKGFRRAVLRGPSIQEIETFGFDSPHGIITQTEKDRLAGLIKHFRDYWIGGMAVDSKTYPMDVVRTIRWMFSRDDKPEFDFSANKEMSSILSNVENAVVANLNMVDYVNKNFLPNFTGYIWHSFLLRATFYVMSPALTGKFSGLRSDQQRINSMYEDLDRVTMHESSFKNMAGGIPVSTAELARAINTAVLIRDLFPERSRDLHKSGYRLVDGVDDEAVLAEYEIPFSRRAVLKIAQEYGMGEGFDYEVATDQNGQSFFRLNSKHDVLTLQHLANRIVLLSYLFDQNEFKSSKGG